MDSEVSFAAVAEFFYDILLDRADNLVVDGKGGLQSHVWVGHCTVQTNVELEQGEVKIVVQEE